MSSLKSLLVPNLTIAGVVKVSEKVVVITEAPDRIPYPGKALVSGVFAVPNLPRCGIALSGC